MQDRHHFHHLNFLTKNNHIVFAIDMSKASCSAWLIISFHEAPKVVGSDYVGSHWLASFLLHALEQRAED